MVLNDKKINLLQSEEAGRLATCGGPLREAPEWAGNGRAVQLLTAM